MKEWLRAIRSYLIVLGILLLAFYGIGYAILNFDPSNKPLQFSSTTLPAATTGVPYEVTVNVSGNVTAIESAGLAGGRLPEGLEIDAVGQTGGQGGFVLHGTPTTAGTYAFTIRVLAQPLNVSVDKFQQQYAPQSGDQDYALVVN